MSGRKPFSNLTKDFNQERRAKIEAQKVELREEMALHDLRKAIGTSQEVVAHSLGVKQPAIAKMERRTDIRIQSLRRMIEAMGGTLEISARFENGKVRITNYTDADSSV
jgi:ribosome-binding protein aMBF1 (putative translation factor)